MRALLIAIGRISKLERMGYAVMSFVIILLLLGLATMHIWVQPTINEAEQRKYAAAYAAWKAREDSLSVHNGSFVAEVPSVETELFSFDPNTLDSIGFLRLGMPMRAVKGLMNWRRKGKRFYKPEDLKPLYNLPEEVYVRIAPYIHIEGGMEGNRWGAGYNNVFPAIPDVIDLNSVDSAILDRGVPGVGSTLAHKILERRAALGGFIRHEQLLEVYRFPDTTFQRMKEKLRINASSVRRMPLNSVSVEQMSRHPYVGEKVAQHIDMYREGIKRYESVEQLRQVPLMNEEIYRKIAPYFVVD